MSSHNLHDPNATSADDAAMASFSLSLLPDPGALPRVIEIFAKRGMVPASLHAVLSGSGDEARLVVDLLVADLSDAQAEIVAEILRQIVVVERVLTARKGAVAQAA